jgi:DNA-directed RNA polymerase specialized sigma24 family protein
LREWLLHPPTLEEGETRWEQFEDFALDEVYPVLMAMIHDQTIYAAARQWGRVQRFAGPTPPPGWTAKERKKVVVATIDDAITFFKTKGLEKWNPNGGTSLKTWFTNACLMHFADAFNRWYTETRLATSITRRGESQEQVDNLRLHVTSYDGEDREFLRMQLAHPDPGPEEQACLRDAAERVMAAAEPLENSRAYRTYLQMEIDGYTPAEAREITNLPEHIIRTRKKQHRRNLQVPDAVTGEPLPTDTTNSGDLPDTGEAVTGPEGEFKKP